MSITCDDSLKIFLNNLQDNEDLIEDNFKNNTINSIIQREKERNSSQQKKNN